MCTQATRCSVTARLMTWEAPSGTWRGKLDVRSIRKDVIDVIFVITNTPRVVCGTDKGEMVIVDIESHQLVAQIKGHSGRVRWITVSKDGSLLASCSDVMTVRLASPKTCKALCEPLTGHTSGVCYLAMSDDSKYVASRSFDRTVRIWDVPRECSVGTSMPCNNSANGSTLKNGYKMFRCPLKITLSCHHAGTDPSVFGTCAA